MADPTDQDEPDDDIDVPTQSPSPVDEAMRFLLWARKNRFAVPALRIGDVELRVQDLKSQPRSNTDVPEPNVWAAFGLRDQVSEDD